MARVLISYLVKNSGHHAAAKALADAFKRVDPQTEILVVDLLSYTHPKWAAAIERIYMSTIRRTPDVWEALYDNAVVERLTRLLRGYLDGRHNRPLLSLMRDFAPDAAVCTQAHPLGVLNAWAARSGRTVPLWGVVTDYVPHRYWVLNGGTSYVVPTQAGADRLVWLGVDPANVETIGIPIAAHEPRHPAKVRDPDAPPRILVMGGSRGLGVRYRTIVAADRSEAEFTLDIITGTNRRLRKKLLRNRRNFRHPVRIRGYVRNAGALMPRADLLISKPGGLTSAEAMAVGLPMLIVRPLPGQEMGNAEHLTGCGAAIHLKREREVSSTINTLLGRRSALALLRARARAAGRPDAAEQIARRVLAGLGRLPRDAEPV